MNDFTNNISIWSSERLNFITSVCQDLLHNIGLMVTNVLNKVFSYLCARVNDCVVKVNNVDLTNVEYRTAVQAISRGEVVNMVSEVK